MGASKDMFMAMEQETLEEIGFEQVQPDAVAELVTKIKNKSMRLSFSSLNAFKTPMDFIAYKLKKFTPNKDMVFGSLCHKLILQPHLFDEEFKIVDKAPTTDNQKNFVEAILAGSEPEAAFAANYKSGNFQKTYDDLLDYIVARESGKEIIGSDVFQQAKELTDFLMGTKLFQKYLAILSEVEVEVKWTVNGWFFKGFIDGQCTRLKFDLKYTKDASPKKFEREIFDKRYYMQAAMYDDATPDQNDAYAIIAFDKKGNYHDVILHPTLISYGKREYRYLLHMLEKCAEENRWDESYNFWDVEQRTLYKPKFLPGFPTDPDNVE